eukprot:4153919-Pleurochrysis_carterae.AAC.1
MEYRDNKIAGLSRMEYRDKSPFVTKYRARGSMLMMVNACSCDEIFARYGIYAHRHRIDSTSAAASYIVDS